MKDNKKMYLIIGILTVIAIIGGTLAWGVWRSTDNPNVTFSFNGLDITSTNVNISGSLYPTLDKNSKNISQTFTVVQNSDIGVAVCADFTLTLTTLPSELIDPTFVYELYNGTLLIGEGNFDNVTQGETITIATSQPVTSTVSTYKIMLYIDGTVDNSPDMAGKTFSFDLGIVANQQEGACNPSKFPPANEPILADGMIPIKYNTTDSVWTKNASTRTVAYKLGDVNGDGMVDVTDGGYVLLYINSRSDLTIRQQKAGDVDGDGVLTDNDRSLLLSFSVSIIDTFPAGDPLEEKTYTFSDESPWYDYDNKKWANAVMVKSISTKNKTLTNGTACTGTDGYCTREDYMNATDAIDIPDDDILGYYVWIPRYRYQLFNVSSESISPTKIKIAFENDGDDSVVGSNNGDWITHPAFTFGSDELPGIWVGKFETSSDTTCTAATNDAVGVGCNNTSYSPLIKPNVISWRGAQISTLFTASQKIATTTYLTNTGINQIDAHMMKNTEWGAVAYLKQSKYGLGVTDIGINSYNGYNTGCGPLDLGRSEQATTCNKYSTALGQSSSTTGNIYGVYDMSGGASEYVMGASNSTSSNNAIAYGNSGFTTSTLPFGSMYLDHYNYSASATDFTRRILGDATSETINWYNDLYQNYIYGDVSWFGRGGMYNSNVNAGIFAYQPAYGQAHVDYGSRIVVVPK